MGLYFESFRKSNFDSVLQLTIMEFTTTANGFVLFSLITLFGIHKGNVLFLNTQNRFLFRLVFKPIYSYLLKERDLIIFALKIRLCK